MYNRQSEKQSAASESNTSISHPATLSLFLLCMYAGTRDKFWLTLIQSDTCKHDDWQKSNIGSCLEDSWLAVTQDAGRSKYVIMLDSHLLKLIQIRTKYFAAHVCMSSPRAPTVSQPTLDLQKCSSKKCQHLYASGPVMQKCKLNRKLVGLLE